MPPALWFDTVRRTLFQPWTRMSGWCPAASAASATRLTKAIAAPKSAKARSRTIASSSRRHPETSCRPCSMAPSSSSSAISSSPPMRIVSLVPHATELLFALGLGDDVVGVTHECDFPERATELPQVTRDVLPAGLSAGEIDAAVRERTQAGDAIYALDEELLRELDPDLIVTQELCPVCAVSYEEVEQVARTLPSCPQVVALDPKTFGETMGDIRTIAQATRAREAALDLVARQRA